MSKANNAPWERVFEATNALRQIEKQGYVSVLASDLKKIGEREPRLLAKLDTTAERPDIFKKYGINILPVQNGKYVLFPDPTNSLYFKFDANVDDVKVEEFTAQIDLDLFDSFPHSSALTSESQVIDFAFITSLMQHFCATDPLYLTIRGRLSSGQFEITLESGLRLPISQVQIETDSGYENNDSIILIEAKMGSRPDFNVRQLIFPYLQWQAKTRKVVRPIFLTYSNGKFVFTEFSIGEIFGDVKVLSSRAFVVNDNSVVSIDLQRILRENTVVSEPNNIPFPQANDMDKIVDLIALLQRGTLLKAAIAAYFEFDERQADYYANAACYLGFVTRTDDGFELTHVGREFLKLKGRTRRISCILIQMVSRQGLRSSIELLAQNNFELERIASEHIKKNILSATTISANADTLNRRTQTVFSWLKWLARNAKLA